MTLQLKNLRREVTDKSEHSVNHSKEMLAVREKRDLGANN